MNHFLKVPALSTDHKGSKDNYVVHKCVPLSLTLSDKFWENTLENSNFNLKNVLYCSHQIQEVCSDIYMNLLEMSTEANLVNHLHHWLILTVTTMDMCLTYLNHYRLIMCLTDTLQWSSQFVLWNQTREQITKGVNCQSHISFQELEGNCSNFSKLEIWHTVATSHLQ